MAEIGSALKSAEAGSRCVGRERQLAELTERYRRVQRERNLTCVLVSGVSGVGKSDILTEFRSRIRLDGGVVLEGHCQSGHAFAPFAEIVAGALRFLSEVGAEPSIDMNDLGCRTRCHAFWYEHRSAGPLHEPVPELANDVHDVLGDPCPTDERRIRFFDSVRGLLGDVSRIRPPVILLHDLEQADHGTLQLLETWLDQAGPWTSHAEEKDAALILASIRADAATAAGLAKITSHRNTTTIQVGELDADGVRAYLQSPTMIARVLERTGGMPEAINLLLSADPLSPGELLQRHLQELPESARALMNSLAVLGEPARLELLAEIARLRPDARARSTFSGFHLLERRIEDGCILFSFAREVTRQRVYQQLSEESRKSLHLRCVEIFRERRQPLEAVRHALIAGDTAQANDLALDAALSLAARHAHGEAAQLLEEVLEANDNPPIELHEQLAELYRTLGDYRSALHHGRRAREINPHSSQAARVVGHLLTLAGQHDDASKLLEEADRMATSENDPVAQAQARALLAELHCQRAAYADARAWAAVALRAAEELGHLPIQLHVRNTLGKLALWQDEDPQAAQLLFEENQELAGQAQLGHQQAQAATNLGVALLRQRAFEESERAFSRAASIARDVADTREEAIATENLAVLAHMRHDYCTALSLYHQAVGLLKRLGNRSMLSRAALNLGELYLCLGDTARATALCDFAAHMGGTEIPLQVQAGERLLRGRVAAQQQNKSKARRAFEEAHQMLRKLGAARHVVAALECARAAAAEGDVGTARNLLAQLPFQESTKRTAEILLVRIDIERADGQPVHDSARRAVDLATRAGDDELELTAALHLARALCEERHDPTAADAVLARAQEIEERMSTRVPAEVRESWEQRPQHLELLAVERLVRAAWRSATRESGVRQSRISSVPSPPPPSSLRARYPHIAGSSCQVETILTMINKVAPTDALVLIRGESGTGKELIAEALHEHSPRRNRPLVKVNCAALVETLLLSELFGHERGSFTGANARKKGRFEVADGGTIFLDEIGDISAKTQVALLRVLQEREFERVGGTQKIKVDVRIVAATHRDLEQMVKNGSFREDLYYRLRGVTIDVPSLRSRLSDIPALCTHLLVKISEERGEPPKRITDEALELLSQHCWPGNIRELENVLRSATLFADSDALSPSDFGAFSDAFRSSSQHSDHTRVSAVDVSFEDQLYQRIKEGENSLFEMKRVLERECIQRALDEAEGNITRAAVLLGMKRPRLSQLVKQYELTSLKSEGSPS